MGRQTRGGRALSLERIRWILPALGTVVLLLCVASAANYSSVVFAQATVDALPTYTTDLLGLASNGSLSDHGSVNVMVRITVENPSGRTLRLLMLSYSGWMEDGPAEVGLAQDRRFTDDRLASPSGTRYFLRVFGESRQVQGDTIPARGNATLLVNFTLDHGRNPARFDAVRNITAYAARATGPIPIPWNHWIRAEIRIEGVPDTSSSGGASYLRALPNQNLGRIDREVGTNLAT